MKKRAIILVPGFSKREQFAARDQLVKSLTHYTDGYKTSVIEGGAEENAEAVTVTVKSRNSHYEKELDIYEAFWGDLIPDWSQESPWQRFKRGLVLIMYWAVGGLAHAIFIRKEPPSRTVVGLAFWGLVMVAWYFTVINVLAIALQQGGIELEPWAQTLMGWVPYSDKIIGFFAGISDYSIYIFILGILGVGYLEGMANVSAFLRAYLRDDPMGEDDIGLRAKSRHRVLDTLDKVYKKSDTYDEVYVVAHSLGGAIAVDALAECGKDLSKTTLHTWGALLGLLSQQEVLVEREVAKLYGSEVRIGNWIDVVFKSDMLASPRRIPRKFVDDKPIEGEHDALFPDTIYPAMPTKRFNWFGVHSAYFRCETVMLALVAPAAELPPLKAATD